MRLRSQINLTALAVFIMVQLFVWCPVGLAQVEEGQMAPNFTLHNLKGETVSLESFKGKPIVLDFWATWCLPCRKSLPELAKLDKKYRGKGVVFLGLSIDDPDSYDNQYVAEFKDQYGVEYEVLRATSDVVANYLGTEDVRIPAFLILDQQGKVVKKHLGFEEGILESALLKLLSDH